MNELKARWGLLQKKLDALSLRERAMAFAIAALLVISVVNTLVLDPLSKKQKKLSQQVTMDRQQITAIQEEITSGAKSYGKDPDASAKQRLQQLQLLSAKLHGELSDMKVGLVSPDKMAFLLGDMLKKNGALHLNSLKTLPVSLLDPSAGMEGKSGRDKASRTSISLPDKGKNGNQPMEGAIYKHGMEIVLEGRYLDLMNYLAQLEVMPWRLFWERASLKVNAYPDSTLTLTLFTLSFDKEWLNI